MLKTGCTSLPISGNILTELESRVLHAVKKQRRWDVINGRSHHVYGLSMEAREKFIPEAIRSDFKIIENFSIRALNFHGSEIQLKQCKGFFDRDFENVGADGVIVLQNDDGCEAFIAGKNINDNLCDELYVGINDRSSMKPGKKIILMNDSNKCIAPFSRNNRKVIFKSYPHGASDIWLNKSELVLLQFETENEQRIWREIGRSRIRDVCFDINPLARQSGPVFQYISDGKSTGVDYALDGELFIPLPVIEELLKKIKPIDNPYFQWLCSSDDLEIEAFFQSTRMTVEQEKINMLVGLVYEHLPEHHTVTTTLYVRQDIVYCYLHETLGRDNELAGKIRTKLKEKIHSAFVNHFIFLIAPVEAMQKDFSVCGVFAIKMMHFVAKNHQAWGSFLKQLKVRKPQSGEVEVRYISVRSLPAEVLKMCQDSTLISPAQKKTMVGKKNIRHWDLTLGEYRAAYKDQAALVKLFKYYADYAAILRVDIKPQKAALPVQNSS